MVRCASHSNLGDGCLECAQAEEVELDRQEVVVQAAISYWVPGDPRVAEATGIMAALVTNANQSGPMAPHELLDSYLPDDLSDALWIRNAVLDLLVAMTAASVDAAGWSEGSVESALQFFGEGLE